MDIGALTDLIEKLVVANHILFDHGVVDAFGHISARHPAIADRFFLARNRAPGAIEPGDILEFDMSGETVQPTGERVYLERFLHSEIYRARPDVMAIVHSHSHSIVPFSVLESKRLQPIFHMAGFIGTQAPVFEIRERFGECTDLLIRDRAKGAEFAKCFANHDIALMRGHGSTVVADSIERVVFRAVYAEINARMQFAAASVDSFKHLTEQEARSCMETNEGQVERPWALWAEQAAAKRARKD